MPLNPYFLQGSTSEQRLVQDLINEQLRMYGQDVVYLPRKIVNKKSIIKEIVSSSFDDAYRLEAYLLNYQGFEGSGDVLSKFGVTTTDSVNLVVSKEKYEDFITPFLGGDSQVELSTRPQEGDLVYLPLDNTMFEIKYVEARKPFYQLNNLYVYTLSCEVMDAELDQDINTSIEAVDTAVDEFGFIVTLGMVGLAASTATATVQKATSVSGFIAHWRKKNVDIKMGIFLLIGGLIGSTAGVNIFSYLKNFGQIDLIIQLLFLFFLGFIGFSMAFESARTTIKQYRARNTKRTKLHQHSWFHGLPFKVRFHRSKLYISAIPPVLIGFAVGVMK